MLFWIRLIFKNVLILGAENNLFSKNPSFRSHFVQCGFCNLIENNASGFYRHANKEHQVRNLPQFLYRFFTNFQHTLINIYF